MTLINAGEDVEVVQSHVEAFEKHLAGFMEMQVSVQRSLPVSEREGDHKDWYEPKLISFRNYLKKMKKWFKHAATSDSKEVTTEALEASIHPHDGIANTSSKRSHTSSVRVQAEAERAALMAKAAILEEKYDLEIEQAHLKAKKEKLELKAQMATNAAKLNVLNEYEETQSKSKVTVQSQKKSMDEMHNDEE